MSQKKQVDLSGTCRDLVISKNYISSMTAITDENYNVFVPYKRTNLLTLNDFYERLMNTVSVKGTVIPRNCRYIDTVDTGYKILVIEDPPTIRSVLVDMDFSSATERFKITGKDKIKSVKDLIGEKRPHRMRLSFPFVIYLILFSPSNRFHRMKIFYRLSPITSPDDYLLLANLPNISGLQHVCLGDINSPYENLSTGVNAVIDSFWFNTFNTDYITNYQQYSKIAPEFQDFVSWAYNTAIDPMFIFSVKYLKHERNLKQECTQTFREFVAPETDSGTLYQLLYKLISSSQKVIDGKLHTAKSGSVESYFIKNKAVSIGDTITYENKTRYINDIIIDQNTGNPSYFSLEDENGNTEMVSVSSIQQSQFEIKEPLLEKLKLADGSEVSAGDSVVLQYPFKRIRTIEKIRMGRDGNPEVILKGDNELYLLHKIGAVKMGDIKPQVNGINVNKDDEYILYRKTNDIFKYFSYVKYVNYEVSSEGYIVLNFIEDKKYIPSASSPRKWRVYDESVEHSSDEWALHLKSDFKLLKSGTFRIANKLFQNKEKDIYVVNDSILFDERKYSGKVPGYDPHVAINDILIENGNKLFIPSYDIDIEFNIGDTVVVADWDNVYSMVTPRVINAFICENRCLYILTLDPETGEMRKDKYIDFNANIVYVGSIRKIDLNVKDLEYGTLISAKEAWIQNFPKKDVNKIIGVISDTVTNPPMILCSNGLTIWADEIDQFNLITKSSRSYKSALGKIVPAVDPKELKDQLGDFYLYYDKSNKVHEIFFSKTTPQDYGHKSYVYLINASYIVDRNGYNSRNSLNVLATAESFEKHGIKRYGIIRPRYSERRRSMEEMVSSYPNMLGGHVHSIRCFKLYKK